MRIGRLRHIRYDLPSGWVQWVEGRDIHITVRRPCYIRDLEADDLLDITGMLTPQEQTAYTSQPVSPPPHSCGAVSSYQHARTATTSTTPTLQAAVSYAPTAPGAPSAGLALRCALDPTRRAGNTTTAHRGGGRPSYGVCRVGGGWSGAAHARDHCTSAAGQTANTAPPARCSTDAVDVPAAGDLGCGSRREVGRRREGGGVQRYTERGR